MKRALVLTCTVVWVAAFWVLFACDDTPHTIREYTDLCRKLGGHTVQPFSGSGYTMLICVSRDGRILEPR